MQGQLMQETVDAIRRGDRDGAKVAFARNATAVLGVHRLQIIANSTIFCTGIDVLLDVLKIGISDSVEDMDDILAETATATELTPLVHIGTMLVCGYLAVIRDHDTVERLEFAPSPTIYIADRDGSWVASDTDLEHAMNNPSAMQRVHDRRREQRKHEISTAVVVSDQDQECKYMPPHATPQCPDIAQRRALVFLKEQIERDLCIFPQFRAVMTALPSLLEYYAPNLGMILALLQTDGENMVECFEVRYPVSADDVIHALRMLLPLSTPRDRDTELRRMRKFLRALLP